MTTYHQPAFPGMEPPQKARQLSLLFWEAAASHWGPIMERIASEQDLGPEGISEADLEGVEEFMSIDQFRAELDRRGVAYREGR